MEASAGGPAGAVRAAWGSRARPSSSSFSSLPACPLLRQLASFKPGVRQPGKLGGPVWAPPGFGRLCFVWLWVQVLRA